MAHAEQIINLKNDKIILNTTFLKKVLSHEDLKEKPVCVVSIAGAFRQGKSFLLNFLVRYLHVKYKLKKNNLTRWLDSGDGPISGFPWKAGSERHTVGILMWSEVFLAQLPSGEEIAIILLDTQGSFDNVSTVTNCAAIFALSTLISSIQIYNLVSSIKQYDLSHLECFAGYGRLAADFDTSPFQNLLFLIRDWPWAHEKEYGARGGQKLLNQIFNNPDQPSELAAQIKNIKELFKKISCFLLPHPGFKVAASSQFSGHLEDLDPIFKQQIEDFVPTILAPENLAPKRINGDKIKLEDLLHFIESYCQQFQSGAMPSINSMFKATSDAQHAVALKEAEIIYEKEMDSVKNKNTSALEKHIFQEKNQQSKDKALEYFRNKKMMANEEIKRNYDVLLEKMLLEKYIEYENINDMKYQKELEIKREAELRRQQQLDNEERMKEQQELHEENLRQEQKMREEEVTREENLRKEQQSYFEQKIQEEKALREQERKEAEERIKQQQEQHKKEIEDKVKEAQKKKSKHGLSLQLGFGSDGFSFNFNK